MFLSAAIGSSRKAMFMWSAGTATRARRRVLGEARRSLLHPQATAYVALRLGEVARA